jgi:hypothetical protein
MTDEQQDALTGKLVREHATLLKEIATLEAEGKRIGRTFRTVADVLDRSAQNLIFDGEPHDARFNGHVIKAADLDAKHLLETANDLRTKIIRRDEVANQLKAMGVDLAHL